MFRIPGARLVPISQTQDFAGAIDPDKDAVVVCLSGERSAAVTLDLRKRGFDRVYNLTGGMVSWVNEKLPVERG